MSNEKPESRDEALARAVARLSPREAYAYEIWKGTNKVLIGSVLNTQLFQLYLQGKSLEEIRRINPQLQLGEIVAARVEGRWDDKRDEYLQNLLQSTSERVQQSTLETIDFVRDMLAVAKRQFGDKFQRYLQTGDEKELGEFKIESLTQLKAAIEALQKLTGQEKRVIEHRGGISLDQDQVAKPVTAAEASRALKLVISGK